MEGEQRAEHTSETYLCRGYQQSWENEDERFHLIVSELWMSAKTFSMEIWVKHRRTGKFKVLKTVDEFECFNPHANTKLEL